MLLLSSANFFSKLTFSKKFFRNTIRAQTVGVSIEKQAPPSPSTPFNFCILTMFFSTDPKGLCIRVSNSFDPDQARHFVGLDLGLNCLQRLLTDNKSRRKQGYSYVGNILEPVSLKFKQNISLWQLLRGTSEIILLIILLSCYKLYENALSS